MIKTLTTKDIDDVSKLHSEVLGRTLVAKLGEKYLKNFYRNIVGSGYGIGFTYIFENRPIGFIAGSTDYNLLDAEIKAAFDFNLFFKICKLSILKPLSFLSFFEFFIVSNYRRIKNGQVALLISIGVNKKHMKMKIGSKLVSALIKEFRRKNVNIIYVYTEKSFSISNKFYRSVGFKSDYRGVLINSYYYRVF
jgi:ribosomal protein S18 acetylase RimI-like enzyme|tara:strand:+ start:76 stop:654 length:579 start_codon:yes stop_codon:yes gene_type:complete